MSAMDDGIMSDRHLVTDEGFAFFYRYSVWSRCLVYLFWFPMRMAFTSPRMTALYHMVELSPICTSPMMRALSAIHTFLPIVGVVFFIETIFFTFFLF